MKTSKIVEVLKVERDSVILKYDEDVFKKDEVIAFFEKNDCCLEHRQHFQVMVVDRTNHLIKISPIDYALRPDISDLKAGNTLGVLYEIMHTETLFPDLTKELPVKTVNETEAGVNRIKISVK